MSASIDWDALARTLREGLSADAVIRREEPLATKTTLRVGGAARVLVEPAHEDDLCRTLAIAAAHGVTVYPLGRGSNLLVPDGGVDGVVVTLVHASWAAFTPQAEGGVWVGAGLRLKNLCGLATAAGLVGFEFLEGIPGNVGGALRMNAGAMGGWMFDVVEEVRLMHRDGTVEVRAKASLHVDYRHCAELGEAIALGARLRPAAAGEGAEIARQIDVYRRKRHESQPREPSAGCMFKNPPSDSAGKLIDRCGLKGRGVGGAEVSTVHANFIINRGGASAADVIELVRQVRASVRDQTGVVLQPEVLFFGGRWEDVL